MIDQLTVFLENAEGRLASLCRTMADNGHNMSALTIAETSEYGIVRIICDDAPAAAATLEKWGFRATKTKVVAAVLPNRPGSLAELLEALDAAKINVEYAYCFSAKDDEAVDVLKVANPVAAEKAIAKAGFKVL